MASGAHVDDDDDFGGDFNATHNTRRSGNKRGFGDLEDDEDEYFGSNKANSKVEETAPGVATGMILSLRESLKSCEDALATCRAELEGAKSEIRKWHSSFQSESFIPAGASPEPKFVINYLQNLKSSEESLRDQLEKAKKKEAAFIVTFAKREQEIAELKAAVRDLKTQLKPPSMQARRLLLDPAIHEEFTRLSILQEIIRVEVAKDGVQQTSVRLSNKPPSVVDGKKINAPLIKIEAEMTSDSFTLEGIGVAENLVEEKDKKVKELQDNIAAVSFTPSSKMGKMLMAKCRTLQEENEDIGNQAAEGKMHELALKLALQKSQNAELRSQFAALHKHMDGLINDVERSNEMVIILQEKLEEKDRQLQKLKQDQKEQSVMEEENADSDLADKKESNEDVVSGEAAN